MSSKLLFFYTEITSMEPLALMLIISIFSFWIYWRIISIKIYKESEIMLLLLLILHMYVLNLYMFTVSVYPLVINICICVFIILLVNIWLLLTLTIIRIVARNVFVNLFRFRKDFLGLLHSYTNVLKPCYTMYHK